MSKKQSPHATAKTEKFFTPVRDENTLGGHRKDHPTQPKHRNRQSWKKEYVSLISPGQFRDAPHLWTSAFRSSLSVVSRTSKRGKHRRRNSRMFEMSSQVSGYNERNSSAARSIRSSRSHAVFYKPKFEQDTDIHKIQRVFKKMNNRAR